MNNPEGSSLFIDEVGLRIDLWSLSFPSGDIFMSLPLGMNFLSTQQLDQFLFSLACHIPLLTGHQRFTIPACISLMTQAEISSGNWRNESSQFKPLITQWCWLLTHQHIERSWRLSSQLSL